MNGPLVLQPGKSRLEFTFAPIRLRSQSSLRFRYILDRFDRDWSVTTSMRTADYNNLPAGRYRFRVRTFEVSNPDAVREAAIEVVQLPFFYRTWWFIAGCILLAALLIFAFYQYRVRQVRGRFEAVLEERSRLAREMHDTVIQGCTGVSALLEALSMESVPQRTGDGLMDFARVQLRSTIDEARNAVWNLRQSDSDTISLGEKLKYMVSQVGKEFGLPIACSISGTPFGVSHPIAHDLLMVVRGVYNAALHGHPVNVGVSLTYSRREIELCVFDDGCGFDTNQTENRDGNHFGLKGMRERIEHWGGKFRLTSEIGNGVRIEVRLQRRH
jgi:signal transduction histidine kinase